MDARIDPLTLLGLELGDAHVIRNAGGTVTDGEIRSLSLSQHLLGTNSVIIIQHTDCGMLKITDDEFVTLLRERSGAEPPWPIGAISDLERSVCDSIERVKASPFLSSVEKVRGFVCDVAEGALREVTC